MKRHRPLGVVTVGRATILDRVKDRLVRATIVVNDDVLVAPAEPPEIQLYVGAELIAMTPRVAAKLARALAAAADQALKGARSS